MSGSNPNTHETSSGMVMSVPGRSHGGISATASKNRGNGQDITIRIETTKTAMDDRNELRKTPLVLS